MSEHFTIHRAPEGRGWPFGAGAVAAVTGLLGGVIAMATPMAALDWASYQLYLDQLVSAATPPLGFGAKLIAIAALALLFGALGYGFARWAGVRSTGGFASLIARLRGVRPDDDDDAPRLRGADRHPDAPARRPLSANRDLSSHRQSAESRSESSNPSDDDDDELLLVSPMPVAKDTDVREPLFNTATAPQPDPSPAPISAFPARPPLAAVSPVDISTPIIPIGTEAIDWDEDGDDDDDDDVYIAAPHADDWHDAPAPIVSTGPSLSDLKAAPQRASITPPPPTIILPPPAIIARDEQPATNFALPPRTSAPPPLDLSVARLDELIARVEAGMARRSPPPAQPAIDETIAAQPTASAAPIMPDAATTTATRPPAPAPDDDAFPSDPALAAALATLRRMAAA